MIAALVFAVAASGPIAETPPMGWNSYDCFDYNVTEAQVLENAEFMSKKMRSLGWRYVVVDYLWSTPAHSNPNQTADFQPRLSMDKYGRLTPDVKRFPSAANGMGFGPLAAKLHRLGFKFGIHLMRGIPRQAVAADTPVEGSKFTTKAAGDTSSTCGWNNQMYGINTSSPAGQAYLDSIFKLYASWGVDFVKVDDCSQPYHTKEIEGYHRAIVACRRPIILSLSPGPTPLEEAQHVAQYANMWRLLGDLWDDSNRLPEAFKAVGEWAPYAGPGHWPDPDMLPLGYLREDGPPTGPPNTDSRLTLDEQRTVVSLWCIAKCPMMVGGDLPKSQDSTVALLTDPEVLKVNQQGSAPRLLGNDPYPVWISNAPGGGVYAALFNTSDKEQFVPLALAKLGWSGAKIRDLWVHSELPASSVSIGPNVSGPMFIPKLPPHGAGLYLLKQMKRPAAGSID